MFFIVKKQYLIQRMLSLSESEIIIYKELTKIEDKVKPMVSKKRDGKIALYPIIIGVALIVILFLYLGYSGERQKTETLAESNTGTSVQTSPVVKEKGACVKPNFIWEELGPAFNDMEYPTYAKICSMKYLKNTVEDPELYGQYVSEFTQIAEDYPDGKALSWDKEEILFFNALKTGDISKCSNLAAGVNEQLCKAAIGKNPAICENNAEITSYCSIEKDDIFCKEDNWKKICTTYATADTSNCKGAPDYECKILMMHDLAIRDNNPSICPKRDQGLYMSCRAILGDITLPEKDACIDSFYYYKAKSERNRNYCVMLEDSTIKEDCIRCSLVI